MTVRAVDAGFIFASGVALLAALVCLARGDDRPNNL
jgi:sugar phosphate permease